MRRNAAALALLLLLLLLLSGCGGGERGYAPEDARTLLDAGLFEGDMAPVDAAIAASLYGIDGDTVRDCACYMAANTAASSDEVTVLVLTDEAAAQAAEEACQKRVEALLDDAGRYTPDAVPRLEAAVIRRSGNTVLLAVGDPESLAAAVDKLH